LLCGDETYLEIKPKGVLSRSPALESKYEDIGRFLTRKSKHRFGLMEWQWDGIFERNVSLLSRYWNVQPSAKAMAEIEGIGPGEFRLGAVFARVGETYRTDVWAALAKQRLTADLRSEPITDRTWVSPAGVIYDPVDLSSLITKWWA